MDNYNIKINLSKLKNVFVKTIPGKHASKKCLCIPIDDAGLFCGKKGIYLSLAAWPIQKPQFGETHIVKQAIVREKYNQLTPEEKQALPILGGLEPFVTDNTSSGLKDDEDLPY